MAFARETYSYVYGPAGRGPHSNNIDTFIENAKLLRNNIILTLFEKQIRIPPEDL